MQAVLREKAVGKWAAFFHTDAGPEVSSPRSLPIRARFFIWCLYVFVFGIFIAAVVVYTLTTNVTSISFSSFDAVGSCVTDQFYNSRYSGTVTYSDEVTVETSASDPAFGSPATRVFWSVEFYTRKALVDLTSTLQEPPTSTSDGHPWAETITEYVTGHSATEMYALYQPSTLIVLATWTSTLPTSLNEPMPAQARLFNYYDPSSGQTRTSYCYNYGYHEFSGPQTTVTMNYDNTQTNLYPCTVSQRNATSRGWTPNQMKELRRVLFLGISQVLNSQLFPRECLANERLSVSQIISLALSIAAFAVTVARYALKVGIRVLKLQPWFMPNAVQEVSLVGPANANSPAASAPPPALAAWNKKAETHEMPAGYRPAPSQAPHPDIPQAGEYNV